MVLIGDPKQAIYAFRGGDVTTYLQAAETAATQQTLSVNWRSDAPLLDSFQRLLSGAALGDERIVVRDVEAHHQGTRLAGVAVALAVPGPGRPPRDRSASAAAAPSPSARSGPTSRATSPSTYAACSPPARPTAASRSARATSR